MKIIGTTFKLKGQNIKNDGFLYFTIDRKEGNKYHGHCLHGLPDNATNNGFQITSRDLSLYLRQGLCFVVTDYSK